MDLVVAPNLACALIYGGLGFLLAIHSERRRPVVRALVAACAATAVWALAVALDGAGWVSLRPALGALSACRGGAWIVFLWLATRAALDPGALEPPPRQLVLGAAAAWLALVALEVWAGSMGEAGSGLLFARLSGRLVLTVPGLILVETLWRGSRGEMRWRLRYLCIGIGGFLFFDLFVASEALLFRRFDPALEAARGAVSALVAPLVGIAAARNPSWSMRLNLGRRAVTDSVVLVGIGVYLLALAGAGIVLRALGGDQVRLLQATVVFSGLLLLVVAVSSRNFRSITRRRITGYLFTYRHDYRETWRKFAETLSAHTGGATLRERALQAVADILGSPGGALWIREGDVFARVAMQTPMPTSPRDEPVDGRFATELWERADRALQLGDASDPESLRREPWVPDWLRDWRAAWVVVPLVHRSDLLGFIVLTRPPAVEGLDAEDEELLDSLARQVTSYLAEERQTRALEETRRFGEFSRNVAFIAHDLRNLANELSLTLSNARSHIQNPDFQQDLLLGMEESVARMQRLLDRLKGGGPGPEKQERADLVPLLGDWLTARFADDPHVQLELETGRPLPVAGSPDRVVAMTGHLVRNAIEAAGADGRVRVRLRREGEAALFEVEDDGPGMTRETLRERLHHPFGSSKPSGFGIGLYECRELASELGGQLSVESEPGRGTVARVWLPLVGEEPRHAG